MSERAPRPQDPNPEGRCQCGCGKPTGVVRMTEAKYGRFKGHHNRFLRGHNTRTPRRPDPVRDAARGVVEAWDNEALDACDWGDVTNEKVERLRAALESEGK